MAIDSIQADCPLETNIDNVISNFNITTTGTNISFNNNRAHFGKGSNLALYGVPEGYAFMMDFELGDITDETCYFFGIHEWGSYDLDASGYYIHNFGYDYKNNAFICTRSYTINNYISPNHYSNFIPYKLLPNKKYHLYLRFINAFNVYIDGNLISSGTYYINPFRYYTGSWQGATMIVGNGFNHYGLPPEQNGFIGKISHFKYTHDTENATEVLDYFKSLNWPYTAILFGLATLTCTGIYIPPIYGYVNLNSTTAIACTGTFISRRMRMTAIQLALDTYEPPEATVPDNLDYIKAIDIKPLFEREVIYDV